jgi:hypothetical protein
MRTLLDWASRYPVFVEFAGYRFVLGSAEELAVALECKLAEHRGRQTPKT